MINPLILANVLHHTIFYLGLMTLVKMWYKRGFGSMSIEFGKRFVSNFLLYIILVAVSIAIDTKITHWVSYMNTCSIEYFPSTKCPVY